MFLNFVRLAILFTLPFSTNAGHSVKSGYYDQAIFDSADLLGLNGCLLKALLIQEGGEVGKDTIHSNGSVDTGLGQINKNGEWMRWFDSQLGLDYETLRDNGYINILASAVALKIETNRVNGNAMAGVAAFHRGPSNYRDNLGVKHAKRVLNRYSELINKGECNPTKNPSMSYSSTFTIPASTLELTD